MLCKRKKTDEQKPSTIFIRLDLTMNKTAIRTLLAGLGISGVVSSKRLADALKISIRTINAEKLRGHVRQIDRNTYDLESIVEWLYSHPRYMTRIESKEA